MLTGLIIACEEAEAALGLRAELGVAGQTVLEHQARLLADAGAARVIIVAEQLPETLAAGVNRLRRDGIALELVRQVGDVAQRVPPDERLLMLGDGVVTDAAALASVLAAPAPAILVLPDLPETRGWELIDASSRWAGVLSADGELVRRTARMLGEWDLQSTLLRNALQAGAGRVNAEAALPLIAQVTAPADAHALESALSRVAARRHTGLTDRILFDPLARLIAPKAMGAMIDPAWLRGGAAGLMILAALFLLGGWRWTGIGLALLSGPLDSLGRHLAALTMRLRRDHKQWTQLRSTVAGVTLLSLGWELRGLGWGTVALTAGTVGLMVALTEHERWIGRPPRRPLWFAEPDGLAWAMLPFGLAGWWTAGLAGQAAWAFATLLAVQRLTKRQA
jgi:hypothetical protein